MNTSPACIAYTQDAALARRIKAFLRAISEVRHVSKPDRLEPVLEQTGPALLVMDLRARECRDLIEHFQTDWPDVLIMALGISGSDPLREAEFFGIYAVEDLETDRRQFQAMVGRAFDHLRLAQENRELRAASTILPAPEPVLSLDPAPQRSGGASLSLLRFPRVFRRFADVDSLLANVVESFADAAGVTRVGIFARDSHGNSYRLRAGLRCLRETYGLEFNGRDPLVRWFEQQAVLIGRTNLARTADQRQRTIMRRALDAFGAEVIVPLYAQREIFGWMFFGQRFTGLSFEEHDLEVVTMLAEHVSTVLENNLLHEETTLQKTLAETVLKAISPGIVATDHDAIVRWINPSAEKILGAAADDILNKPVESAGSRLAGLMRETLDSKSGQPIQEWTDNFRRRRVAAETRWLGGNGMELGAVAIVNDVTAERTSREKQALQERAAFWTDLAAGMSHEIRNPLVAIKTFAQLLPERFDDNDFRKEFNEIVLREIDRLDQIITEINDFANPPELLFRLLDVRAPVQKAVEMSRERAQVNGRVSVEVTIPNDLPKIMGDESALTETFAHLIANAAEAMSGQSRGRITLSAKPIPEGDRTTSVVVTVRDTGKGIAPELKEKVFSPFCTTKPRGIGLGLPIVKRTVFDHNGRIEIDSSTHGTCVNVILPAKSKAKK
jgi:two-component system, NtrC family, sensor histidine kinase AtoS